MKIVATEKAPAALGPYSQGYTHGGMFYSAGQLGADPATGDLAEGIEGQADRACQNMAAVLEAAGTSFDKVVKTTCFLADMGDFPAFNSIYEKYFVSCPARSCVAVRELPKGVLCEIEAIAYLEEE